MGNTILLLNNTNNYILGFFYLINWTIIKKILIHKCKIKNILLINNIISIIHSIILSIYGLYKKYYSNFNNTNGCIHIIFITLSYFINDIINIKINKANISFIIHHLLAILLVYCSINKEYIYPLIAPFSLIEISSIFLNIGYVLNILNCKNSLLYKINKYLFATMFFIVRIIWMPYLLCKFILYKKISDINSAEWCVISLGLLNFLWFKYIISKLCK